MKSTPDRTLRTRKIYSNNKVLVDEKGNLIKI